MVKVASYNMHKGVGTDRRRNPERILEVLREMDADVIALQEADRRFGERQSVIPNILLEDHSDYKAVPFDVRPGSLGWHGNALLVRKDADLHDFTIMHIPALEPRGAVMAELSVGGARLRIVGMHLDLSGLWRRRQAKAILREVNGGSGPPSVLMGDTNEWSSNGGCLRDFGRDHVAADCGKSFHARRPVATLDRIFVDKALTVLDAGTHDTAASRKASDHLPVWAEISD